MRNGTALLAVSTLHRALRVRRIVEPLATVAGCSDPAALPMLAVATGARLVIVDLDLVRDSAGPNGDAIAAATALVERLRATAPDAAVVLIADGLAPDDEIGLLLAGLSAACTPGLDDVGLARILRAAHRGEVCVRRGLVGQLVRHAASARRPAAVSAVPSAGRFAQPNAPARDTTPAAPSLARLTARELDIARAVGDGLPNKVIAAALGITERTVKAHLTEVFRKLAIADRVQLALLVARHAGAEPEAADA